MNVSITNRLLVRFSAVALLVCSSAAVLSLTGCEQPQKTDSSQADPRAQSLPTVLMQIGNRKCAIEVAATNEQQELGLMYRDSMPPDHGMIFVFPDEQPRSFWMKNTRIPLDIVYLDHTGKIVSIQSMKPLDLTGIDSGKPAMYAIELNVNVASAVGLKVGDTVQIPDLKTAGKQPTTEPGNVPAQTR